MKKLKLVASTFVISQFGMSSIANAFDVFGSVWFTSNGTYVSTNTTSRAEGSEDIDETYALALLKVVLSSAETEVARNQKTCSAPLFGFWFCTARVFTQYATAGCKYCNRGNGLAFGFSGDTVGFKALFNKCKTNSYQGYDR